MLIVSFDGPQALWSETMRQTRATVSEGSRPWLDLLSHTSALSLTIRWLFLWPQCEPSGRARSWWTTVASARTASGETFLPFTDGRRQSGSTLKAASDWVRKEA